MHNSSILYLNSSLRLNHPSTVCCSDHHMIKNAALCAYESMIHVIAAFNLSSFRYTFLIVSRPAGTNFAALLTESLGSSSLRLLRDPRERLFELAFLWTATSASNNGQCFEKHEPC